MLETIINLMIEISKINTALLMLVFVGFIVLAYKVFQTVIKAFIVGVIAAAFPIVANLMGMDVPLTLSNIIWFAIMGVTAFLVYASVTGGIKVVRIVMKPFNRMFSKKPVQKIIIREKEPSS